jgi:toxin-antitoxin system PIN domain toxin
MSAFLLDVNVLIALMWPAHQSHSQVEEWFSRHARQGWATCPFTEAAFVRLLSNPAFSPDAVTPHEAIALLSANLKHRYHRFWGAVISLAEAVEGFQGRLVGHRQVTDAYLLGLAIHKGGKFATLDRSVAALLPEGSPHRQRVEIIG